jgi:2-methylfumaryl-CoA isomerase
MLAAIRRREQTGEGSEVRIPLSDVAIGTVANLGGVAEVLHNNANRPRLGNAVYGLFGRDFVTKDNVRTMVVVVTHRQWANLVGALGLTAQVEAIEAERGVSFGKDDGLRFQHRDALYPLFERAIGSLDHAMMASTLDEAGIVHSAYRTMLDAAHDPRLVGNNPMFSDFDATIPQLQRGDAKAAPRNGEHSEEILSSMLHLSSGEIARLIDSGTVGIAQ